MAEREGFEPPDRCRSMVFKTTAFDHSATSPYLSGELLVAGGEESKPHHSNLVARPFNSKGAIIREIFVVSIGTPWSGTALAAAAEDPQSLAKVMNFRPRAGRMSARFLTKNMTCCARVMTRPTFFLT